MFNTSSFLSQNLCPYPWTVYNDVYLSQTSWEPHLLGDILCYRLHCSLIPWVCIQIYYRSAFCSPLILLGVKDVCWAWNGDIGSSTHHCYQDPPQSRLINILVCYHCRPICTSYRSVACCCWQIAYQLWCFWQRVSMLVASTIHWWTMRSTSISQ